jgi:hypothetical protein
MQAHVTLERPSTTDGQTDVDRGSDERDTSRQKQHHHTYPSPDTAPARWTDTVVSTSSDLELHDSTVGEHGGASTTDGQTVVAEPTSSATRRDRSNTNTWIQRVDIE